MVKDSPPRRILKRINQNQQLPEVEKKVYLGGMYTDKHIQKLAHANVESEPVKQLIDSTARPWTVILSDSCGSLLKFGGRWVLGLVWIAQWAEVVIRRASCIELDCSFHAVGLFVYFVPVYVEENESRPIGLAIVPSEPRGVYE
jgi:hypothetical protein